MKTVINIKTDKNVKKDAQKIASDLGLSLSAVINAYLKQFVRNREIHFSISPKMSSGLENLLGKIEFDIQRDRNISNPAFSKKELKKQLSSL